MHADLATTINIQVQYPPQVMMSHSALRAEAAPFFPQIRLQNYKIPAHRFDPLVPPFRPRSGLNASAQPFVPKSNESTSLLQPRTSLEQLATSNIDAESFVTNAGLNINDRSLTTISDVNGNIWQDQTKTAMEVLPRSKTRTYVESGQLVRRFLPPFLIRPPSQYPLPNDIKPSFIPAGEISYSGSTENQRQRFNLEQNANREIQANWKGQLLCVNGQEMSANEDLWSDEVFESELAAQPLAVHHFNWLGQPTTFKSDTPPAVSFVVITSLSQPRGRMYGPHKQNLHKSVLFRNGLATIDPVYYYGGGADAISGLRGTALQEAVTGGVAKMYSRNGYWHDEVYEDCEDVPESDPLDEAEYEPDDIVLNGWYENHGLLTARDFVELDFAANKVKKMRNQISLLQRIESVGLRSNLHQVRFRNDLGEHDILDQCPRLAFAQVSHPEGYGSKSDSVKESQNDMTVNIRTSETATAFPTRQDEELIARDNDKHSLGSYDHLDGNFSFSEVFSDISSTTAAFDDSPVDNACNDLADSLTHASSDTILIIPRSVVTSLPLSESMSQPDPQDCLMPLTRLLTLNPTNASENSSTSKSDDLDHNDPIHTITPVDPTRFPDVCTGLNTPVTSSNESDMSENEFQSLLSSSSTSHDKSVINPPDTPGLCLSDIADSVATFDRMRPSTRLVRSMAMYNLSQLPSEEDLEFGESEQFDQPRDSSAVTPNSGPSFSSTISNTQEKDEAHHADVTQRETCGIRLLSDCRDTMPEIPWKSPARTLLPPRSTSDRNYGSLASLVRSSGHEPISFPGNAPIKPALSSSTFSTPRQVSFADPIFPQTGRESLGSEEISSESDDSVMDETMNDESLTPVPQLPRFISIGRRSRSNSFRTQFAGFFRCSSARKANATPQTTVLAGKQSILKRVKQAFSNKFRQDMNVLH